MHQRNFALIVSVPETGNKKLPGRGVLNGSREEHQSHACHPYASIGMYRLYFMPLSKKHSRVSRKG